MEGWKLDNTNLKVYILGKRAGPPPRRVGVSIEQVHDRHIISFDTYGMQDPPAQFPKTNFVLSLEELEELGEAIPSIIKQYKLSAGIEDEPPKANAVKRKRRGRTGADEDVEMDDESEEEELDDEEPTRKGKRVKVNVSKAVPAPNRGSAAEVYEEIDSDDLEAMEAAMADIDDTRKGDEKFVTEGNKNLRQLLQEESGRAGPSKKKRAGPSKKSSAKGGRKTGRR